MICAGDQRLKLGEINMNFTLSMQSSPFHFTIPVHVRGRSKKEGSELGMGALL